MSEERANLGEIGTSTLRRAREAIASGELRLPLTPHALGSLGIRGQGGLLQAALAGHGKQACLAILDVVLAERAKQPAPSELVWTGPEAPKGAARDTAVVLRELFEGARKSVILAGYSFDHAQEVLAPLATTMKARDLTVRFFVDIPQVQGGRDPKAHLAAHLGRFVEENWPFGPPRPQIYYDRRALEPGPPWASLHAKCVVVDYERAFISSANFTQRGQERNIEAGVLIHEPRFSTQLAAQWMGLISANVVAEFAPNA